MSSLSIVTKVLFLLLTFSQLGLFALARPRGNLNQGFSFRRKDGGSSLVTNAARMQAGFGPLKPRKLFNPSRVAARDPSPSPAPCSTGDLQCCTSAQSASSGSVTSLLGLLGIAPGSVTGLVGITCSPISASGVGGNSCPNQALCCSNNSFNGIIALGCTPVNINQF